MTIPLFASKVDEAVQIRICRTDVVRSILLGQHSEYIVEVSEAGSGERLTVSKRYRNFVDLHTAVSGKHQAQPVTLIHVLAGSYSKH